MKRSAFLKQLSREHHLALSIGRLCVRAAESGDKDNISAVCKKLNQAFLNELEPHFKVEENTLFPRMQLAGSIELVKRALNDHATLRALMAKISIEKSPTEIAAFGNLLISHVRFEERELFNVAEKLLNLDAE